MAMAAAVVGGEVCVAGWFGGLVRVALFADFERPKIFAKKPPPLPPPLLPFGALDLEAIDTERGWSGQSSERRRKE